MGGMDSQRRGLYNDFRGYRVPTEAELTNALRTATIVVDANVLLDLYRYNEATRDDLLGVLRKLGDRLWLPHQVVREFWRNRLGVLANRGTGSEQALTAFARQQRATVDAIHQWAKATAVDARARDALIERVDALYTDFEATVRAHSPAAVGVAGGAMHEPVVQALESLLDGRVGPAPAAAEWQAAVTEGKARVDRREPPGYADADKIDTDLPEGPAGDYLVWRQAIDEAGRRGGALLLR
ncbi:MAG: PIN-like domain-containing protein [Pseudonocardiaceae bacterium]